MTPSQRQALEDIRTHGDPYRRVRGQSQHGGWHGVMRVILRRRWARHGASRWRLTVAGARELAAVEAAEAMRDALARELEKSARGVVELSLGPRPTSSPFARSLRRDR